MKEKRKIHKLLSLLLCCAVLMGMMPMATGTAFAADDVENMNGGSGEGWSYDGNTKTLTLDSYTGTSQVNTNATTIMLNGTNAINFSAPNESAHTGLSLIASSEVTIKGEGSLTITVGGDSTNVNAGVHGINAQNKLSIEESALVTITAYNKNAVYGIYAKEFENNSGGNLKINVTTTTDAQDIRGIELFNSGGSATFAKGTTEITVSGNNPSTAYGIYSAPDSSGNIDISGGKLKITMPNTGSGILMSKNGKISISGGETTITNASNGIFNGATAGETDINITGGKLSITSEVASSRGVYSNNNVVTISNAEVTINTTGNCIYCGGSVNISGNSKVNVTATGEYTPAMKGGNSQVHNFELASGGKITATGRQSALITPKINKAEETKLSIGSSDRDDSQIYQGAVSSDSTYTLVFTGPTSTPSATVKNVTVDGNKDASIAEKEVKITLNNDGFKGISTGTDVSSWFTNLPAGLTAKVKDIVTDIESGREEGVTITIRGTPTVTSNAVMAITIPAACLVNGTSDLTVTTNNDAKYDIDVLKYSFSITSGEGITLGDNSNQTVEAGQPISEVICTANAGYYFPIDYSSITTNSSGISITRNSYTQISVSGTPTADVAVGLAAATAKVKETTPAADFAANGENRGTLSNVETGMKYSLNGGTTWIEITGTTVTIESGVTAENDIKVKKPATNPDTKLDSDVQIIDITKAAKPTGVTGMDCTTASNNDGKLTNVTSAMEYKKSEATSWTDCVDSEVTGLSNGTYYIRTKASGTAMASDDETVVIAAYDAVKHSVTVTVNDASYGTASASKNADVAAGETITLTATPNEGYVFDKWEEITPSTLTINADGTFTMPNEEVSVKAYFKPVALTGTVTITGELKFGAKLTASVSDDSNNTGTLTYNWYRDGETTTIGNEAEYTIVAADINKTLTCKVTSSVQTGTIEESTAAIQKADGPSAPGSFTLTFTLNADGTTFTATIPEISGAEYSFDGTTWSNTRTKADCQPNTSYTGYARIKETETHNAGAQTRGTKTAPKLQVSTPTFTPNGAAGFSGTQAVTISCGTAGATIYYTTDGTEPTTSGTVYSTPLNLTATTTVKAIAVKDDMENSAVATATFTKSSGGSSGGGGGGGSYRPSTPTQPTTPTLDKAKADSIAAISAAASANKYDEAEQAEVKKIVDKANADIKNAKTEAEVQAIQEAAQQEIDKILTTEEKAEIAAVKNVERKAFEIKSKATRLKGKKAIRLTWTAPEGIDVDGYEIFRSTKKNSGYGTEPFFTTTKTSYTNNKNLKAGKTYYYKVRAFVIINGEKVYTDFSLKAWRKI